MEDRRREPRLSTSEEIIFSVNTYEYLETKWVESRGRLFNRSEKGLCIITPFPLEPGHVLIINNQEIGVVKWVTKENSHSIVGVQRKGKIYGLS